MIVELTFARPRQTQRHTAQRAAAGPESKEVIAMESVSLEKWQTLEETRQRGSIDAIHRHKGFGFVTGVDKNSYFFHLSALENCRFHELEVGAQVDFCIEDTGHQGGPRAVRISVLSC